MSRRAIDANVILCFLLEDPPEQAERCRALLQRLQRGEETVYLPEVALSDVIWTLQSFYRWPRERIATFAHDVTSLQGVEMARRAVIYLALHHYVEHGIDYSDALIAAEMAHRDCAEIYSYDRDLDRVTGITRIAP